MKIAICNVQEFNPTIGGIERVSVSLAYELVKNSVDVIFVSCRKSKYSKEYQLPAKQYFLPSSEDYAEENVAEFARILQEECVDIILNQNSHSYLFNKMCAATKAIVNIPMVSVYHFCPDMRIKSNKNMVNFNFFSLKENIRYAINSVAVTWPFTLITMWDQKRLFSHMVKVSDKVVLLSDNFKNSFSSIGKIKDDSKIMAINNMLSFEFKPITNWENKSNEIVFVGRMAPQKNPYRVLEMWKKIQDSLPNWKLKMIGDGPFYNGMKRYSKKLRLKNIELLGFKDPRPYLEKAKILVMTSNYEGFPLVLTEAMQYGCVPVVFNSFESITDIISDNETGYLIKPFDINEIADAVMRCCQNQNLRDIGIAANNSMKKLSSERIVSRWISLFNSL